MTEAPVPDWVRPVGGFTAMDLDHLPDLPPHTELIDGGLVFVSPQRKFHMKMVKLLADSFERLVPAQWHVCWGMSVVLGERQRLEPDVMIVNRDFPDSNDTTWYPADAVLMVIEVVSPESMIRDRDRKPQLYAQAGVTHFWRVEESDGRAVVYVYELDPSAHAYSLSGIHHRTLETGVPFPITIDLDAVQDL